MRNARKPGEERALTDGRWRSSARGFRGLGLGSEGGSRGAVGPDEGRGHGFRKHEVSETRMRPDPVTTLEAARADTPGATGTWRENFRCHHWKPQKVATGSSVEKITHFEIT